MGYQNCHTINWYGILHRISASDLPSGFGFELTLRLKREPGETAPPTWPAAIMQALAKYVFQSENRLCSGDHVSWHCPLDNSESRIQHMLMTEDPQLGTVMTPFGPVAFIQVKISNPLREVKVFLNPICNDSDCRSLYRRITSRSEVEWSRGYRVNESSWGNRGRLAYHGYETVKYLEIFTRIKVQER